jgi:phenylacetate-CoA ligase
MTIFKFKGKLKLILVDILRGNKIVKTHELLKRQQYMTKTQLEEFRRNRIKELFHIAKSSTKYYSKFGCYEDIPVLTKEDVREKNMDLKVDGFKKKLYKKTTGGSTGTPMVYYTTANVQSYLWAGILLAWEAAGYRIGDKVAFIAGSALIKSTWRHKIFYYLFNIDLHFASPLNEDSLSSYIYKIKKSKTRLIYGYANAINAVADYINNGNETSFPYLRAVICTSEILTASMRSNIEKAFGVKVFNQYGCNEAGVSAFECEHHKMHLISTRSYYETDDNGNLISTDMANDGFIMMKYNTNDIVELADEQECDCKRNFPIIKKVIGRSNDLVVDMKNNVVHDSFFSILFSKDKSVRQYQVQFDHETISINLSVDRSWENQDCNKYIELIRPYLTFKDYRLTTGMPFVKSQNGKHKQIIDNRY